MNKESVVEYLERHVNDYISDRQCLPQFISYEQMNANIKDSFDEAKTYHYFEIMNLIKYTLNWIIYNKNIAEKNDFQSIAEMIYDEFYNKKNQ
jgi:hypothetical protein